MKRIKVLFINVVVLTVASLLIRTIRISFQVYLSNKMGSAGIGLFQLIMSIYFLAITFSTSGIKITTTRLVAEEMAIGRVLGAKKAIHSCLIYSLIFSISFAFVLYGSAQYIGTNWLGDTRTVLSLRILAFSLPFIATSSVFSGYFTAVRRVIKAASVQIIEQLIKIAITIIFMSYYISLGIEYACVAVVVGFCTGEFLSAILLLLLYRNEIFSYKGKNITPNNIIPRMLRIALPVALSSYVTSSIRTIQQLIVPFGLKQSGVSSENALSAYGSIHGMVMPVIMFPSILLEIISDMIVPELAECQACGSKKRLNYIISCVFNLGMIVSICVMCIFYRFSDEIGVAIYNNSDATYFIRILAPIIPIMYMDTIVDSMLKGIGEQISSMRYNIIESLLSVALIYILLPKYAITGYIITIYFSRILNFFLSVNRLVKITNIKINIITMVKALLCMLSSLAVFEIFNIGSLPLVFIIFIATIIYFVLLRLFSCITHNDISWFRSILK